MKNVIVTDAVEDPEYVRVTNEDGDSQLVESTDPEGVVAACQTLSGGYGD